MEFTDDQIFKETLEASRGSLLLSGDSYLIERPGWYQVVSPSRPEASRNEIIFSVLGADEADQKISELIEFYSDLGTSFKWCINPLTRPNDLPERLRNHRFHSWQARGMWCDPFKIEFQVQANVQVEKVTDLNFETYLDLFLEGWGIDQKLRPQLTEDLQWALTQPDRRFNYFLVQAGGQPVGTAGFVNKVSSAYLVGGNILPQYRGRGYYKALVRKRLEILAELGIPLATTGARDKTSAPILENLGFKTVYRSEIFQYDYN